MSSFFDTPFVADATQAQPTYTPVPEDTYKLLIESAEEAPSKNNKALLKLQLLVESGEKTGLDHQGRKLFSNFNLEHDNPVVVQIAAKQLHALCIMAGLKQINDATELNGRSFTAHVKVKKRTDTGEMTNEVVYAVKKGAEVPAEQPAAGAPSTAPKAAPGGKW